MQTIRKLDQEDTMATFDALSIEHRRPFPEQVLHQPIIERYLYSQKRVSNAKGSDRAWTMP